MYQPARDLSELASGADELALTLQSLGHGLDISRLHGKPDEQIHACRSAVKTLEKVRQNIDTLETELRLHEARIALWRAEETDSSMLADHYLMEAGRALDRAGMADLVPLVDRIVDLPVGARDRAIAPLRSEIGEG